MSLLVRLSPTVLSLLYSLSKKLLFRSWAYVTWYYIVSSHRIWLICSTRFPASTAQGLSVRDLCIPPRHLTWPRVPLTLSRMDRFSIWLLGAAEQCRVLLAQIDTEKPSTEMGGNDWMFSGGSTGQEGGVPKVEGCREGSKPLVLIWFFSSLKCPSCLLGLFPQNPAISITENVLHFKGQYLGKGSQASNS